jgi:hypothetical protein
MKSNPEQSVRPGRSIGRRRGGRVAIFVLSLVLAWGWAQGATAGPEERVKRIHDRLVGVPPDAARLAALTDILNNQGPVEAALAALEHPVFYTSTLKNFVTPWTNVDQTVYAPLNDYTATVIGMVRDDVPFNTVLSADLVYRGRNGIVPAAYSQTNNNHYEQLEANYVDLSNPTDFVGVPQSTLPGSQLSSGDTAGVITTRAAGEAFFSAGTNRRMLRFTAMNYLCRDMEDLLDTSLPADWIRQDIARSPGGDSSIFMASCVGCHNGMDPMAGAFAYFEWVPGPGNDPNNTGRVIHTPGQVQPKHLINASAFPAGYRTIDNRWENRWVQGQNSVLGWPAAPREGYGPKTFGQAIGNSDAFATCQVEKVFEQVCFRPDGSNADRAAITQITQDFIGNGYSLKRVFAEVAEYCTRPDAQ